MRVLQGGEGERARVLLFFLLVFLAGAAVWMLCWAWKAFIPVQVSETADHGGVMSQSIQVVPAGERIGEAPLSVFAVVVENSTDARPQSGIERAFAVYEVPVEGTITRWLALFQAGADVPSVEEIGPVRSARPALLELAAPWEPLFAHVGGSPEALEKLKRLEQVQDLDEFFHAGSFWRSKKRDAPHNVYTQTERLARATEKTGMNASVPTWETPRRLFADQIPASLPSAFSEPLRVSFGHSAYNVEWTWNGARYERAQQGIPSRMTSGETLKADTIVLLKTAIATIDEAGRKRITLTGSGDALFCVWGNCMDAKWKKASVSEPLLFVDAITGERLREAPGVLWVEVVER